MKMYRHAHTHVHMHVLISMHNMCGNTQMYKDKSVRYHDAKAYMHVLTSLVNVSNGRK